MSRSDLKSLYSHNEVTSVLEYKHGFNAVSYDRTFIKLLSLGFEVEGGKYTQGYTPTLAYHISS
jgi:hypothetical protein